MPQNDSNIESILASFTQKVKMLYGTRLEKIILYGSYARGTQDPDSDIDLMVVLKNTELPHEKVGVIGSLIIEMKEQFNVLISMMPVTFKRYSESQRLFYKNIRREGIVIYE
jgi:uncharacterized protein